LALRLGAVHLRIDTIEQALRSSGTLTADVGPAGYLVAYGLAADNLRLGRVVVADSVNPIRVTREAWLAVGESASVKVVEIEVICSDRDEHRRRVETRSSDIDGLALPTWQQVIDRDYEAWDRKIDGRRPIVADTAVKSANQIVVELISELGLAGREPRPMA
jgi:predicted kinase